MNLKDIPKVELHCHLDGIVSPAMIRSILQNGGTFPLNPDELEQAYPIQGFDSFWNWWAYMKPHRGQLDYYHPVIQHYIAELKSQNVRYFELMISSGEIPNDPVEAVDKVTAFREWVNECEAGEIQVEFLVAFGRNRSMEQILPVESKILALFEAGLIVGASLAGPEPGYPVKPLTHTFARFHEAGLGIEIHAGEWVGAESVRDALEHGYPNRIGHGTSLFTDPELIKLFQEKQIHIEMCPTSNLLTGGISRIEEHPLRKARDLGLNFSINSDDPGVFLCSVESEYQLAIDVFGFTEDDLLQISHNALAARFQQTLRPPNYVAFYRPTHPASLRSWPAL